MILLTRDGRNMIHIWKNKWRTLKQQQQQHNALICVHIITEKESARVKKCIRTTTTMKKRFQFDWGAREEQENIRKSFFFIRLWVHLEKKYAFDICNGLLLALLLLSLSHITSNQSFFSFSHCLPCVWLCMSFFFHPHSLFLSMRYNSYSYTPKIKKKTDEIFSMFLHDSMFSSFLPSV